jgi:hypothetical protein
MIAVCDNCGNFDFEDNITPAGYCTNCLPEHLFLAKLRKRDVHGRWLSDLTEEFSDTKTVSNNFNQIKS